MVAFNFLIKRLKAIARRLPVLRDRSVQAAAEVGQSGLFDAEWYLERNPDVKAAGFDAQHHYLTLGWREGRDPNPLFSTNWYLAHHSEVQRSGDNPLLHYIRHGAVEGRDAGPSFRPSLSANPDRFRGAHHLAAAAKYVRGIEQIRAPGGFPKLGGAPRILIIAELSIPQCRKYRVDQKQELLELLGCGSTVISWHDSAACEAALISHSAVFFYRTPAAESVLRCIAKAKALGLPTFWEVDDLIFDPNDYLTNANLNTLSRGLQRAVLSGVPSYRTAMLACDNAIASTAGLAKAMRYAGMDSVHVVENALDEDTLIAAEAAVASRSRKDRYVRIGYGSGTKTHDKDFLEAAPAIIACMAAHPKLRLRVIGELTLPFEFEDYDDRIERFDTVTYAEYLKLLAECDIAIAPLENSVFNDAKSNIKFLEASMVCLPTVCSPGAAFAAVVHHEQNGLLASGTEQWRSCLEQLISSRTRRHMLASAAKSLVLSHYSADHIAQSQLEPVIAGLRCPRKALRVLVVNIFFNPRSFGGATIVAEQMAQRLHERDDTEVVVFTSAPAAVGRAFELSRYSIGDIPVFAVTLDNEQDPAADFDTPHVQHSFRSVVRRVQPDVVHFHCIQGLGAGLLEACEDEGVPYVVTAHDAWWICGRQFMVTGKGSYCFQTKIDLNVCSTCVPDAGLNTYRQYRLRDALLGANLILTPSAFFRELYVANDFPATVVKVNKNGVKAVTSFKRKKGGKLRFGYVGGNSDIKGASVIKSALAGLDRADYEIAIVDNTLGLGYSSIKATDWPLRGDLKILPGYTQETMDEFYSNIDVLLFPTQWKESFGLTIREALIRDIWVITTDAGGVIEEVVNGENGFIIPLLSDGVVLRETMSMALDRASEIQGSINPYKSNITIYESQAEELRAYLACVAQDTSAHARKPKNDGQSGVKARPLPRPEIVPSRSARAFPQRLPGKTRRIRGRGRQVEPLV